MRNRGWYPSQSEGEPVDRQTTLIPTPAASHWKRGGSGLHSRGGGNRISLPYQKKHVFCCHVVTRKITHWYTTSQARDNKTFVVALLSRVVTIIIHTFSGSYTKSVTMWRRDNKKSIYREREIPPISHFPPRSRCHNKRVSWRNKAVGWHPYCISKRNKDIYERNTMRPLPIIFEKNSRFTSI